MIQYNTIEDAIFAIFQKYGVEVFGNTPHFIALLSDYAPNHIEEQLHIRAFVRNDGITRIINSIKKKESYSSLLASICETAVRLFNDTEIQHSIVENGKKIASMIDIQYSECPDPSSVYAEGLNFFRKFPKDKNVPIAILLFEESLELGCNDALIYLSSTYLKGKGVQKNVEKGMYYLELAAESGNVRAALDLAQFLWKGTDINKDIPRAVSILKGLNDSNAFFMLGEIFHENTEYENAFNYYLKAAENNQVYAQFAVAVAFATGQGVKRDIQEAKKWLRSAASLGHGEARRKLEELGEKWE